LKDYKFVSIGGIDYVAGSILIIIGILVYIAFNSKAKKKAKYYKSKQLEQYNKNNKTNISDYKKTNLYLPFFEKIKFLAPSMISVTCVFVGLSLII
jgi:hypothetical protein